MSFRTGKIRNPAKKSEIHNRLAFTMMELMLAIGIFAVGMSLVAGLFPAAIKEAESTVKDYEGPIICENGLAIAKARLEHIDNTGSNIDADTLLDGTLQELPATIAIGNDDRISREYDIDGNTINDRQRGFTVLAMQWGHTYHRNDYQLVIVAYDIAIGNSINTDTFTTDNIDADHDYFTFTGGDTRGFVGATVIDPNSGRYATILSVDGTTAYLDHSLGEPSDDPIVIREVSGTTGTGTLQETSPVLGVLTTRTALRD